MCSSDLDSSTGIDAPQPMEARFDDFMLATASFPRDGATLGGPDTHIVDSMASTVERHPVRLAHLVRTRHSDGAGGRPTLTDDWTLIALIDPFPVGTTPPEPGALPGVAHRELGGDAGWRLLLCSPGRVGAEHLDRLDTMVEAVRLAITGGRSAPAH